MAELSAFEQSFLNAFHARGPGGPRTHFGFDYAQRGTSICKDVKCKSKICKGELRVYKDAPSPFATDGSLSRQYYHAECFFLRVAVRAHKWRFDHANELENYWKLTEEDKERAQALNEEGNASRKVSAKDAKLATRKDAAIAKFEKAQARANAKLEKEEAKAAKAAPKPKDPEAAKAKRKAWYEANRESILAKAKLAYQAKKALKSVA